MNKKWVFVILVIKIAYLAEGKSSIIQQPRIGKDDGFVGAVLQLLSELFFPKKVISEPCCDATEIEGESVSKREITLEGKENGTVVPIYGMVKDGEELSLEQMRKIINNKHSVYRRLHKVKPLIINKEMNEYSQKHAEYIADLGRIVSSNGSYGENMGYNNSKDLVLKSVIIGIMDDWYNEVEYYDFSRPERIVKVLHFTQLVWKDSKDIGIGVAIRNDEKTSHVYVVCNYDPAGNLRGAFEDNVFPRVSSAAECQHFDYLFFVFLLILIIIFCSTSLNC